MHPQISVILAVYNEDKYIRKCLRSLAEQIGVKSEVIVVDDGSTDNSKMEMKNVIRQLADKNKNFRYFWVRHQGTAKARNFGAKKANGKILVFVDGDMEFEKDFLKRLTLPILKGKTKGTFSTEEFVANWENHWARCWNLENNLPARRRIDTKRADMVKDFRAILKKEFLRVKGFDDVGYTDTWTLSEKLGYKPQPTKAVYYHYNPDNLSEVLQRSIWIGGRRRRLEILGKILALVRASLPFSIVVGFLKSFTKREPSFLIFKIIYDLGISIGIIQSL